LVLELKFVLNHTKLRRQFLDFFLKTKFNFHKHFQFKVLESSKTATASDQLAEEKAELALKKKRKSNKAKEHGGDVPAAHPGAENPPWPYSARKDPLGTYAYREALKGGSGGKGEGGKGEGGKGDSGGGGEEGENAKMVDIGGSLLGKEFEYWILLNLKEVMSTKQLGAGRVGG
jgi:hypothetical protein